MAEERVLRLGIDPRPAEDGARKFKRATDDAAASSRKLADTVEEQAKRERRVRDDIERMEREWVANKRARAAQAAQVSAESGRLQARAQADALEAQFRAEMAAIKEAQARGFLTPAEAAQAGRESAMAYNQGVLEVIDQQRGSGALTRGTAGSAAYSELAGSLKNVGEEGKKAGLGMGHLRESVASLAAQSVGAHPVMGRLANVVGSFALGGAMTVGVLGGLAAIGLAMRLMGEDAKEARERQEELLGTLEDLAERRRIDALGPGGEFVEPMAATEARIAEIREEIERRREIADQIRADLDEMAARPLDVEPGEASAMQRALEGQREAIAELTAELHQRNQALRAGREETEEARAEAEKAAAEEAKRLAEERERQALLAEGRRAMQADLSRSTETLQALDGMADSLAAKADSLRLDIALARSAEEAGNLHRELVAVLAQLEEIGEERIRQMLTPGVGVTGAGGTLANGRFGRDAFSRQQGLGTGQLGEFGLDDLITPRYIQPINDTTDAIGNLAKVSQAAAPLLGEAGNALSSILGGIAAGGAMGATTAIVGAVGALLSGLTESSAEAARVAAGWDRALDDFASAWDRQTLMQERMSDANQQFLDLANQAGARTHWEMFFADMEAVQAFVDRFRGTSTGSLSDLAAELEPLLKAYEDHVAGMQEVLAEQEANLTEDLEVRMLRAQGLDEEADALAFAIKQERELAKAREQYGADSEVVAYLEQVQAAEAAAEAMKELNDAMLSVTTALNSPQGLNMALLEYNASLVRDRSARDGGSTRPGGPLDYGRPDRRGSSTTYNVEINVNGTGDARETARMVMEEWRREALTGSGDPTEVTRF